MESLPVDVLQNILCRVPLRDVLMLKAASPEFHKLVDLSFVKEAASELARGVYWQTRRPAFAAWVGCEGANERDHRYLLFVLDTHGGRVYHDLLPVLRGQIRVITTCKSLVLVSVTSYSETEIERKGWKRLFVFNLSSASLVEIPQPPRHYASEKRNAKDIDCYCFSRYSIGFDVDSCVCTVIRIYTDHSFRRSVIDVYSSRTGQWRTVSQHLPFMILSAPDMPLYSKGRFLFPYNRQYGDYTRVGVFDIDKGILCSIKLPPGRGDHYYARERWMLCGCDGHVTLVYNEDFIRTGEGWKLDEAALNQKSSPPYAQKCGESSIECWDGNYWKECDEKTAAVLKVVDDIHKKEVESTYWSNELNLDQGSNHIGFPCAWKDSPDDRLRVYNAKGEVVNRLTASYLHSVLDIAPYDLARDIGDHIESWPLEISNIAWPWPQRDYESFVKHECDGIGLAGQLGLLATSVMDGCLDGCPWYTIISQH